MLPKNGFLCNRFWALGKLRLCETMASGSGIAPIHRDAQVAKMTGGTSRLVNNFFYFFKNFTSQTGQCGLIRSKFRSWK